MKKLVWAVGTVVALALCVLVLLGFAGRVHPLGDTISLLRLPLGVICLATGVLPWSRGGRIALLGAGVAGIVTTVPALLHQPIPGDFTLYSKNLLYSNSDRAALVQDIRASDADVLTLQEVGRRNDVFLTMLLPDYPHQHLCRFAGWSGVAVLSKRPFVSPPQCSALTGVAAAQVDHDGRRVWVASVHLPWPYPYLQDQSARAAVQLLERLDGAVVVAGDFNSFPWSSSVRAISMAARARSAGPLRPTFDLGGVPLFLDHVYAPGGGQVTYRRLLGSDHLGVLARVHVTPR